MAQIDRLVQLIEEKSRKEGYSEKKIKKIVALVRTTIEHGLPENQDLKDRLEEIGRSA